MTHYSSSWYILSVSITIMICYMTFECTSWYFMIFHEMQWRQKCVSITRGIFHNVSWCPTTWRKNHSERNVLPFSAPHNILFWQKLFSVFIFLFGLDQLHFGLHRYRNGNRVMIGRILTLLISGINYGTNCTKVVQKKFIKLIQVTLKPVSEKNYPHHPSILDTDTQIPLTVFSSVHLEFS